MSDADRCKEDIDELDDDASGLMAFTGSADFSFSQPGRNCASATERLCRAEYGRRRQLAS